jgi:hypothetical protein
MHTPLHPDFGLNRDILQFVTEEIVRPIQDVTVWVHLKSVYRGTCGARVTHIQSDLVFRDFLLGDAP